MNIALILAAGNGSRMDSGGLPKQFIEIAGKPLMVYTLEVFECHSAIDAIAVVTNREYLGIVKQYADDYHLLKLKHVFEGGSTRQQSVYKGLNSLVSFVDNRDIVLVHDAARPFVSDKIITANIEAARQYHAVDTVIPSVDTIVISENGSIIDSVPNRKKLYHGQTPQTFSFGLIYKAHQKARELQIEDASDDCLIVNKLGGRIHLVCGSTNNFKITTKEDLYRFEMMIRGGVTK